jgi:hypothetical protein
VPPPTSKVRPSLHHRRRLVRSCEVVVLRSFLYDLVRPPPSTSRRSTQLLRLLGLLVRSRRLTPPSSSHRQWRLSWCCWKEFLARVSAVNSCVALRVRVRVVDLELSCVRAEQRRCVCMCMSRWRVAFKRAREGKGAQGRVPILDLALL